jgi:ParB-like chromosome segregation protein Spo0J
MNYQVTPDLSPDEYQELKADIAARGVQIAIEYDEDGNVLDGRHRLKACAELGITDFPKANKKNDRSVGSGNGHQ